MTPSLRRFFFLYSFFAAFELTIDELVILFCF